MFVVDDDAAIRDSLRVLLEATGLEARVFGTGEDLLDYEHLSLGGCILLDMCLPGCDGFAVLRHLRDDGITVPVILITSHDDRAERALGGDGIFAVLRKPIDGDLLLDTIARALCRDTRGGSGAPALPQHP